MNARRHIRTSAIASVALIAAACTPTSSNDDQRPPLGHIHALAFTTAGDVLVGSHNGIYSLTVDGNEIELVGESEFDAMGMAAAGEELFASGHPGLRADDVFVSPNIGLVRHTPGSGWQSVALAGETDFHGLATTPADPELVVGLPTDRPVLAVSDDSGRSWSDAAAIEARDIAIDSQRPDWIAATTAEGLMMSRDAGQTFTPVASAPLLVVIAPDAGRDGGLVGIDANRTVWSGSVSSGSFERIGQSSGVPAAIAVDPETGAIAMADDRGVVASVDGEDWDVIWELD